MPTSLTQADCVALVRKGDALERQGVFPEAWAALADGAMGAALMRGTAPPPALEWRGQRGTGRLVVLRMLRHVGAQLRMARVADLVARDSGMEVTLCVELRLVPLLARSFPGLLVCPDSQRAECLAGCDAWASYERVAQHVWTSASEIAASFVPLRPDLAQLHRLSASYRAAAPQSPLIGLSWYSTNARKDLPPMEAWAALLADLPCTALSLQYDPVEAGGVALEQAIGQPLRVDTAIDARTDLDGLATQICATDLVVTVSNTTAHLAGALGHPCIVLLDDHDHLIWPPDAAQSVFYPTLHLIRRAGRPWPAVMAEAAQLAGQLSPFEIGS